MQDVTCNRKKEEIIHVKYYLMKYYECLANYKYMIESFLTFLFLIQKRLSNYMKFYSTPCYARKKYYLLINLFVKIILKPFICKHRENIEST